VKKGATKRPRFWGGGAAVGGAVGKLARDHVLLLGARQQTKWSGAGGRGPEAVTLGLGHSATSWWGVGNPRNRPFGRSLHSQSVTVSVSGASGRRCGRDLGWVRKKVRSRLLRECERDANARCEMRDATTRTIYAAESREKKKMKDT